MERGYLGSSRLPSLHVFFMEPGDSRVKWGGINTDCGALSGPYFTPSAAWAQHPQPPERLSAEQMACTQGPFRQNSTGFGLKREN